MGYFLRKLATLIITLFIVSLLAFLAFQVIPGDVAETMLGTSATPERVEQLREELGLNGSVISRYGRWLSNFLQGDMGVSYQYRMPVQDMLADKLPLTAGLVLLAGALMILVSIPLGVLTAHYAGGLLDRLLTVFNQICMAIPPVFLGILFSYLFGSLIQRLTAASFVSPAENFGAFILFMIFPALSIAVSRIAMAVKLLRSSLLDEMDKSYIRTAYSRGHSRHTALKTHALRNALVPVVVFLASSAAELMAGSIVIEQVFAIPGVGRLLIASISSRDFPVVQAIVVIMAAWVVLVNFLADIISQYIDPRVRLG